MNTKVMLLGLAAVSAAVLALPALASALIPLHLNPTPAGTQPIDGVGIARFSTTGGTTTTCSGFSGSAQFEAGGTTGTLTLTFGPDCTENILGTRCTSPGEAAGNTATTVLPFHLVTLPSGSPGILVTPNAETGVFIHKTCAGGLITVTVEGNGLVGTITSPECGSSASQATLSFMATAHGVQKHTTVAGTETEYKMVDGSEPAALEAHGTLTFKEGGSSKTSQLVCT